MGPREDQVQLLKTSLDSFHVAMGQARLYGGRHRETLRALERSVSEMGPLLREQGVLQFDSSQDGLLWKGAVVRAEDEELSGLGRLLHREGIASISMGADLDVEELTRLMDVLRINFELPEFEEETLESLLWQAGFQNVGFQAVASLMEAEALSGQLEEDTRFETDIQSAIKQISELKIQDLRDKDRRNLAQVAEETVHWALAESDLAGLGPDESTHFAEAQRWHVEFVQDDTEDAEVIRAMREELETEGHGSLVARLVSSLMRAVVQNRPELPPAEAITLARQAVEEIYRRNDAGALVRILDEGTRLMEEPVVRDAPLAGPVRDFYASAISARRVARVLLTLDPDSDADTAGLRRLVERLPDAVLQSILEAAGRDKDQRRADRLREVLGGTVGDRVDSWLTNAMKQPPDLVIPTIALARSLGRARPLRSRGALLAHSARRVRIEVLRWYAETMDPDDLRLILPLVADSNRDVRRAATDVLVAHRPYDAVKWLRKLVTAPSFADRAPELKTDIAITFGLVAQDGAVQALEALLALKPGRGDRKGSSTVEAAARGLAAVGSVAAKQALKKHGSGLFGAKKAVCADAMRRLEGGDPW